MIIGVSLDSLDKRTRTLLFLRELGDLGGLFCLISNNLDLYGTEIDKRLNSALTVKRLEELAPVTELCFKQVYEKLMELYEDVQKAVKESGVEVHDVEVDLIFHTALLSVVSRMLSKKGIELAQSVVEALKSEFGAVDIKDKMRE